MSSKLEGQLASTTSLKIFKISPSVNRFCSRVFIMSMIPPPAQPVRVSKGARYCMQSRSVLTLAPFHQDVDLVAFAAVDAAGQVGDRRFNHVDDLGVVLELALWARSWSMHIASISTPKLGYGFLGVGEREEHTMTSTSLPTSATPLLSGTTIRFKTWRVVAFGAPFGSGTVEVAR